MMWIISVIIGIVIGILYCIWDERNLRRREGKWAMDELYKNLAKRMVKTDG